TARDPAGSSSAPAARAFGGSTRRRRRRGKRRPGRRPRRRRRRRRRIEGGFSMSKIRDFAVGLLLLSPAAVRALPAAPEAPVTVIRAGTLIDGKSAAPRRGQVIVVRGNRIESVGDAAAARIPEGAKVVDL